MDRNNPGRGENREQHVALRKESVDRNHVGIGRKPRRLPSLSARRAWIEITLMSVLKILWLVALRKESVDRNNLHCTEEVSGDTVALRKESVDRNSGGSQQKAEQPVALRKESVDRNVEPLRELLARGTSLSARRAWIEIP